MLTKRRFKFNECYFAAFLLPAVIVLVGYFIFGIEPFGDESVLALDLNGQYVYYFENLRDAFWGDGSFINSWSRNLSGEFVGIFAYYLASPFTLIVMLFPRAYITEAILVMQLVKVGCAGLAFCFYLVKCRKIEQFTAVIFSIMYACCAYMIVQLMNPMWIDGLIYLPLICLAIEIVVDKGRFAFFAAVLALMFIANFYIGWMVAIFCCLYFLGYFFFISDKQIGGEPAYLSKAYLFKSGVKFAAGGILAAGIAAWLLFPLYSSLSLGKFDFTEPNYSPKTYFDMLLFFKNMLPNVYDTCRPEGSPVVYCGIAALILVPLYFMNGEIAFRKKLGFGLLAASILISMYVSTIDLVWHGFQLPNWLPYRYSFLFSFLCLIMAADSLKHIKGVNVGKVGASLFAIVVFTLWLDYLELDHVEKLPAVWFTICFAALYALVLYLLIKGRNAKSMLTMFVCLTAIEFGVSASYNIFRINADIVYSNRSSYNRYITLGRNTVEKIHELDPSPVYRIEKNFRRTVNDAMAFGNFGVSHSSSTMNNAPIQLLRRLGYGYGGHYVDYNGETYVTDALLGIKYVMEKGTPEEYIKDEEGIITGKEPAEIKASKHYNDLVLVNADDTEMFCVYENPYALPIAYMANNAISNVSTENTTNPFEVQNQILSKIVGNSTKPFFKRVRMDEMRPENLIEGNYGAHDKYTVDDTSNNAQIKFEFTAPTDDLIYAYFPAVYERQVNIWIDEEFLQYYFEGGKMCIMTLGRFEPGSKHTLIMTVDNEKDEVLFTDELFYYLDMDMFTEAIDKIRPGGLNVTEFSEHHVVGEVTAREDGILFTSISYEPGWTVYVDGVKTAIEPLCNNALIGVPLTAGNHLVEFKFFPQYMLVGIIVSIMSLIIVITIAYFEMQKAGAESAERTFKLNQKGIFKMLEEVTVNPEDKASDEPNPAEIFETPPEAPDETAPEATEAVNETAPEATEVADAPEATETSDETAPEEIEYKVIEPENTDPESNS
ncbi:MAG: YfhO family protein [Ruminococcus sp.]|jgi:uncharacterized membrane protein YfhO|nr:YfhO family protein [Ruminococcus sp.]